MTRRTPTDDEGRRFNVAIDIVLNSGLLYPYMETFWAYVDGEISEDELRRCFP